MKIEIINSINAPDETRLITTIAERYLICKDGLDKTLQSNTFNPLILVWSGSQGFRRLLASEGGIYFSNPSGDEDTPDYINEFLTRFDSPTEMNYVSTPPLSFQNIIPWLMSMKDVPPGLPQIILVFLEVDKLIGLIDKQSAYKFWRGLKDFVQGEAHKPIPSQRRWGTKELRIILTGESIDTSYIDGCFISSSFDCLSESEILTIIASQEAAILAAYQTKHKITWDNSIPSQDLAKELRGLQEQEILLLLNQCISVVKARGKSLIASWKPDTISFVRGYKVDKLKRLGVDLSPEPDSQVGGMRSLKNWINSRNCLFREEARKYNLPFPKGILLVGAPGTGKSLIAKSIGEYWRIPVLSLDMGGIYGSLLGQSEKNMKRILETAEQVAPCVLFIDELEKGLSGSVNSGASDGGTSSRIFGNFLTWMNDKKTPVFVVATANNVSDLLSNAPELFRKGRWDEIFYVELPNDIERKEVFHIHCDKFNAEIPENILDELVKATEGNSCADISSIVYTAVSEEFNRLMQLGQNLPEKIHLKNEASMRNILARHPKTKYNRIDGLNCILAN
jgi:hypothetical protein